MDQNNRTKWLRNKAKSGQGEKIREGKKRQTAKAPRVHIETCQKVLLINNC